MTGATYDLEFARAARLAASGLEPKVGADPSIEGALLADYLRGARDLDRQGLDLLARLVMGKLRKPRDGSKDKDETLLAKAVRRAGQAWQKADGVNAATTGAILASMLQDDARHIGNGERALLADLVSGEMRRGNGRPAKGAGHQDVVEVVRVLRERMAAGEEHKNALIDTVNFFKGLDRKVSLRTVEKYEAMVKAREQEEGEK